MLETFVESLIICSAKWGIYSDRPIEHRRVTKPVCPAVYNDHLTGLAPN